MLFLPRMRRRCPRLSARGLAHPAVFAAMSIVIGACSSEALQPSSEQDAPEEQNPPEEPPPPMVGDAACPGDPNDVRIEPPGYRVKGGGLQLPPVIGFPPLPGWKEEGDSTVWGSEWGSEFNYDADLGLIALGPEDGPADEPQGGLTVFFDRPITPGTTNRCIAWITAAMMSTTDQRVGTAAEVNGRFYELFEDANQCSSLLPNPNTKNETLRAFINFYYVTDGMAAGSLCLGMREVISSPVHAPIYGEPFTVTAVFTVTEQQPPGT